MSQASSRKLATDSASRMEVEGWQEARKTISNRTIIATMSFLSKKYGVLPCFCEHEPRRIIKHRQGLVLSRSHNAFWCRKNTSKTKLSSKQQQQRNNSTALDTQQMNSSRSYNFRTFRNSITQRFKRKTPVITARSVTYKRPNRNTIKRKNTTNYPSVDRSNTTQASLNQPLLCRDDSQQSSNGIQHIVSQDNSYDIHEEDENDTLEPAISSFKTEQQNINATNNISRTVQETSQMFTDDLVSSKKMKRTAATSKRKYPKATRSTSLRSTTNSSKRTTHNKQKHIPKRKISTSKRKKSTSSATNISTKSKKVTYGRSPFPNPNMFHSMPRLLNSDEITHDNIHENHLCCKPITSVKGLSTNDRQKLIEHDYLTLISLLPIYLGSQGHFQHKIREKTNISSDAALELDRLMNEWGSSRLFIGANSYNKTLTQII